MKKYLLIAALAFVGCASQPKDEPTPSPVAADGWTWRCEKLKSVKEANVCVYVKGIPVRTVFYNHGLGCNQDVLQGNGCPMLTAMGVGKGSSEATFMRSLRDTAVVAVSFGEAYLYASTAKKTQGETHATTTNFYTKILPEVEQVYAAHTGVTKLPQPFHIVGHSMGGFNTATLASNDSQRIFKTATLIHPMIITEDPYAKAWPVCLLKENPLACLAGPGFIAAEFTKKEWPANNPISPKYMPDTKVYICAQDEFKLVAGPKAFSENAIAANLPVQYEIRASCNHFDYPAAEIAERIMQ